jgi:hypothetical protein
MDDECECEDELEAPWVRRFRPMDVAVLALSLITDVTRAISDNFEIATKMVAGHANFLNDRTDFHEQAALEIETLTNGESDTG